MHVIALISQKGGVGSTSLAGHLAVEAENRRDGPVALIDTDPQGSVGLVECARGRNPNLCAR